VGASNELPESEELDALYDRFLLRRTVSRVWKACVSIDFHILVPSKADSVSVVPYGAEQGEAAGCSNLKCSDWPLFTNPTQQIRDCVGFLGQRQARSSQGSKVATTVRLRLLIVMY
jgi:hypothetical protein